MPIAAGEAEYCAPRTLPIVRGRKTRGFDRIVRRCLEKDPARRYPTALALADDLAVCRQGRLKSWALRHRRLASAVGGCTVLSAFLTIGLLGLHQYDAKLSADALHQKEAAWNARTKGVELCLRGEIGLGLLWLAEAYKRAPAAETELLRLLRLDLGAWSSRSIALTALIAHPAKVLAIEFAPDGTHLLTVADDKKVRAWLADGGSLTMLPLEHPDVVLKARFSPDGRTIDTVCLDGQFRHWSLTDGELLRAVRSEWLRKGKPGNRLQGRSDTVGIRIWRPPPNPL